MQLIELFLIAIGLSMDAFAVAICLGLGSGNLTVRKMLTVGLYFGIFQAAMPLIGYGIGSQFADQIEAFDHWIAFGLLALIGGKMIKESREADSCACEDEAAFTPRKMLPLAVATSVDALAVGISFAFLRVQIVPAITLIGLITLALSIAGTKIGNVFGGRYKAKAELAGGIMLVLIGVKIVLEHTGIIG